jgi:hypothetical protein
MDKVWTGWPEGMDGSLVTKVLRSRYSGTQLMQLVEFHPEVIFNLSIAVLIRVTDIKPSLDVQDAAVKSYRLFRLWAGYGQVKPKLWRNGLQRQGFYG